MTKKPISFICGFLMPRGVGTESDEEKPGIIIDYDKSGNIVRIELLDASKKMKKPGSLVYEVE